MKSCAGVGRGVLALVRVPGQPSETNALNWVLTSLKTRVLYCTKDVPTAEFLAASAALRGGRFFPLTASPYPPILRSVRRAARGPPHRVPLPPDRILNSLS